MEWLKNLNEDQKNNVFVAVFLLTIGIFLSWTQGCYETKKVTENVSQSMISEPVGNLENKNIFQSGSTEFNLFNFLSNPESLVDAEKGTWFDFDQVNFVSGTSQLTDESELQIKNIVAVMNHFPNAIFKIGGYTDNTGNEAANLKLSTDRAQAVETKLSSIALKAEQITGSEGYGSQHPVADNTTKEGREKNRRISIRVKSK